MKFMLLILDDERAQGTLPPGTMERIVEAHHAFARPLAESGKMIDGQRLRGAEAGKRVRLRAGGPERTETDGPFAETKEVLGGYYLLECRDMDEAVEWATKVPLSPFDAVEVRPVWER
jgi:hypothetical protein